MNPIRIRPRSSIADPELARVAVVDLPIAPAPRWFHAPRALLAAIADVRHAGEREPEPVIVLTLVPVVAGRR